MCEQQKEQRKTSHKIRSVQKFDRKCSWKNTPTYNIVKQKRSPREQHRTNLPHTVHTVTGYLLCTWLMRASSNSGNTVLSVMRLDHQAWSMFQTLVYLFRAFFSWFTFCISTKLCFGGIERFIGVCIYFGVCVIYKGIVLKCVSILVCPWNLYL